ncbi:hypothetical protein LUZ60_005407 [Juncus effusus]|nr:hypothetical protein LUZ60_005407 [Juncus effusus]
MAAIGDSFMAKLVEEAYALLKDEVVSLSGAASEIESLGGTFRSIQLVLADADRRRIQDQTVNKWLMDLKDVMYDADDVLDECRVNAEKHKQLFSMSFRFSPGPYFHKMTWGYQIKRRIKILNARLSKILADKSNFSLGLMIDHVRPCPPQISRKTSHLVDPDIVGMGIEEDASNLIDLLTMDGRHKTPRVRAIVGIGGIGKTTLARKIYHDERVTTYFIIKLWVSVTQDFTDMDLLRSIGRQLRVGVDFLAPNVSKECLEPEINKKIWGKRFLIVLDDVWNEKVWRELLQNVLQAGKAGCHVLITTRNMGVAEKVWAVDIHTMQLMPLEDGWALLRKKVTCNGEENDVESLEDIGTEIVKKCAGLPLAIKAIGGVMANKPRRRREWETILQNSNWSITGLPEGVHAALYLSYEDLPSHLKECFLYICLFPLVPFFCERNLIQCWIAEGFVKGQCGQELEELGKEYYFDLLQRGLIQSDPLSYDSDTCRVHDLLQSLAEFLAQGENLVQIQYKSWMTRDTSEGYGNLSSKSRRLSSRISEGEMKLMLDFAQKNTFLRTLLLRSSKMNDEDLQYLVDTATGLRVLDLRWSSINKLPKSMGSLIHLRLLVLTDTTITEIPDSIGHLVSLQYLRIQGCENLRKLPKAIVQLKKLRSLDLYGTKIEGMPHGIGQLENLNVLEGFVIGNNGCGPYGGSNSSRSRQVSSLDDWSTLKELKALTNLRRLTIHKLERILQEVTIGESVLKDMSHLEFLELEIERAGSTNEEIEKIEESFRVVLLPPSGIEILIIKQFFGRMLPPWFMPNNIISFLPQLRRLELCDCELLEKLPPLGMLPNLDYLEVSRASNIKIIGNEFLGQSSYNPFPKLTHLIFTAIHNWEEWKWDISGNDGRTAFPCLRSLELKYCRSLASLPTQLCYGNVPLKNLHINGYNTLREISGFSSVKKLYIRDAQFPRLSGFPELEVLVLEYEFMDHLPEWISQARPTLKKLFILGSFELVRKCYSDGPDWPKIQHIPYVQIQDRNHYVRKSPSSYSTGTGCSSYSESLRLPPSLRLTTAILKKKNNYLW